MFGLLAWLVILLVVAVVGIVTLPFLFISWHLCKFILKGVLFISLIGLAFRLIA